MSKLKPSKETKGKASVISKHSLFVIYVPWCFFFFFFHHMLQPPNYRTYMLKPTSSTAMRLVRALLESYKTDKS